MMFLVPISSLAAWRSSEVGKGISPLKARFTNSSLWSPARSVQTELTSTPVIKADVLSILTACIPQRSELCHGFCPAQSFGTGAGSFWTVILSTARKMYKSVESSFGVMLFSMRSKMSSATLYNLNIRTRLFGHGLSASAGGTICESPLKLPENIRGRSGEPGTKKHCPHLCQFSQLHGSGSETTFPHLTICPALSCSTRSSESATQGIPFVWQRLQFPTPPHLIFALRHAAHGLGRLPLLFTVFPARFGRCCQCDLICRTLRLPMYAAISSAPPGPSLSCSPNLTNPA
mmetsp:Transcript_58395/g.137472  ORF Transcript_58395/g.137472 Transcript_58395/m.137472 type:complete len:289 (+) Transcript_58395:880-1746(+)